MWLVAMATGDLADAIHRDLFRDGKQFDDLGWRGLYAYITEAPPTTAIYHHVSKGLNPGDELTLEVFNEIRDFNWKYTAVHFERGRDIPRPQRFTRADLTEEEAQEPAVTWATATLDDIISPEVKALLQGGAPSRN